ncbi:MAG TPA: metal ABC transporter permease [Solirubrobacteraceae bacterium]|jgi:zinc/manganese transport system permease protein|nr:metal ABC transporter permease [Solirubrobacteraceae bacterium]
MFAGFMVNAWVLASIVAVVAGVVGFFVVLRGSAFVAHAVPNGSFAGAAGASLIGVNILVGLGVFSLLGALGIGVLGRRGRHDVVTALALVTMLGLGALFVSMNAEYAPGLDSVLFGEVLGISSNELAPTAALALACVIAIALLYRPLMLSSVLAEVGEAQGVSAFRMELGFLAVVALASTMTVPVVGTLLIFSLMIGAPAAARSLTHRPLVAMGLSVAIALAIVWIAIAASYQTDYPVGFFVGTVSACAYGLGRGWAAWRRRRRQPGDRRGAPLAPAVGDTSTIVV